MVRACEELQNSPLVEVILGVQFKPLNFLKAWNVSKLLDNYVKEFTSIDEREPLEPIREKFEHGPVSPNLFFNIQSTPPLPRFWLTDDTECHLLQIQRERFLRNWKSYHNDNEEAEYPKYKKLKELFLKDFDILNNYVKESTDKNTEVEMVEVTYINHIPASHNYSSEILSLLKLQYVDSEYLPLEEVELKLAYPICNRNNFPIGRLRVKLEPRYISEEEIYRLAFTARIKTDDTSIKSVVESLDLAHDKINDLFDAIIRDDLKEKWRNK